MTSAADPARRPRRPAWAGRNYSLLTAAAVVTGLGSHGSPGFGRTSALWGCSALVVVVTAAVLCVPDVRNLTRRTKPVTRNAPAPGSADAERPVGGLG